MLIALNDKEAFVREAAAEALGTLGDGRAINNLLLSLREGLSSIRSAAATALLRIHDERAIGGLLNALNDRIDVAKMAALTLGRFNDGALASGLEQALSHPDAIVL